MRCLNVAGNYGLLGILDYTHQTDADFQAHKRALAGKRELAYALKPRGGGCTVVDNCDNSVRKQEWHHKREI